MKECVLKISYINTLSKIDSTSTKRAYIKESLLAAGFNLSKSITVKPNSAKDIIVYEQK